jgi:L-ascorbate metabolism protein UlaG (beta-lactamase superfamily)
VNVTFLGQSGFIIRGAATIVIDPFLGELADPRAPRRRVAAPMRARDLKEVALVAVTHHHEDHCHVPTLIQIASASPAAQFVAPTSAVEEMRRAGVPAARIHVALEPASIVAAGVDIRPVPARHYRHSDRPDVTFDYFGYVIDVDGERIYHAGDTLVYDGLASLLRSLSATLAIVPINGRDKRRERAGIVGNMNADEAAVLAANAGVKRAIPCHFDMFTENPGDPGQFVATLRTLAPEVDVWVPSAGESRDFVTPVREAV